MHASLDGAVFRPWKPFNAGLDESQRQAVSHALAAQDVALIHGPPGTGAPPFASYQPGPDASSNGCAASLSRAMQNVSFRQSI